MEKIRYTLEGLDCAGCAAKAEAAVNKAPWIEKATVDFVNKRLTVHLSDINHNADEDIQRIVDSVLVGVNVVQYIGEEESKPRKSHSGHCVDGCCRDESDDESADEEQENGRLLLITTLIALVAGAVGIVTQLVSFPGHGIVSAVAYSAVILLAGYDVMINGVKSIFRLRLDESALMTIAMVAAAILGEFFEGAMVAVLYRIGEWLEDKAVDNSRRSIEALAEIRPDTANVKRSTGAAVVRAEEVQPGETILIRPHERVPLDCIVTDGRSDIDSSALTGESLPIAAETGSELLSGMMNGDGSLTARVTRNYSESAAARIISLVTESSENKGRAEKFVTRFAVVYTPIVVGMAALIAIVPWLLGFGGLREFTFRSLTFLVASCPCAIVISVPLAFFSSIGGASKLGVLVKGGSFAETLAKARAIALDKTGTVTEGKPRVHEVIGANGFTADQATQMAAAAEINSVHPYSQAIREYAGTVSDITGYSNYSELAGHGVMCEDASGRSILCGGAKLMKKYGVELPEGSGAQAYVACDGLLAGSLYISDSASDDAVSAIAGMKKLGIEKVAMLTGDGYSSARQVAADVGIEDFRAELMPEDKVAAMEQIRSEGFVTAFVGDGINDAPVLASADVGIAMGLGSGAAIEAADIVLSSGKLSTLPAAIRHFRRTMGVIRFNIAFALLVKAAVLVAAAFGYAPMWAAVFADVGVCLICVANASRLVSARK